MCYGNLLTLFVGVLAHVSSYGKPDLEQAILPLPMPQFACSMTHVRGTLIPYAAFHMTAAYLPGSSPSDTPHDRLSTGCFLQQLHYAYSLPACVNEQSAVSCRGSECAELFIQTQ